VIWEEGSIMSSKREKKREKRAPMPAQSAGLLRFFEEETEGIKVRPEVLTGLTVALIITAVLLIIFIK
jgi:preprotein translocase subunit Sec61beta